MVEERIARLRTLIARLERLAPSRERDAVLRDVRDRVVTLATGSHRSSAWQSMPDAGDVLANERDVLANERARRRAAAGPEAQIARSLGM
jgi:hypothetical protein